MTVAAKFQRFDDFDHFREALWGWDTEPTQLTRGPLRLFWDQLRFDEVVISRLQSNQKISDRSSIQDGYVGFVVCFGSKIFCGQRVEPGSLVLVGPGREYRNVLDENWKSFEISMSFTGLGQLGFHDGVLRHLAAGPESCIFALPTHLAEAFRRCSESLILTSELDARHSKEPVWSSALHERTLQLLSEALRKTGFGPRETNVVPPTNRANGWLTVSRALEHIDVPGNEDLHVDAISVSLGCTSRALQIAFRNVLGVTPLQYILALRLQRVRRALLRPNGEEIGVTKSAAEHGFLHFGRFAAQYRRMFGERPSDTLMRSRVRINSSV